MIPFLVDSCLSGNNLDKDVLPSLALKLSIVDKKEPNQGRQINFTDKIHFYNLMVSPEKEAMPLYVSLQNAFQEVLDKLKGKQWRHRQIRKISDRVFDLFKNESGKATLTLTDMYIAVLLVYNDMNKFLPGPHINPPSRERVKEMMQRCDIDFDGEIDRNEFERFIQLLAAETVVLVSKGLIITYIALIVTTAVAVATKRATEDVPGIGKVVQRLPISIYAGLVTLIIAVFQS